MFTKTEAISALDVVMNINKDSTQRAASIEFLEAKTIMIFVYPHGMNARVSDIWVYMAFKTDGYDSYSRDMVQGLADERKFPSLKEMLADVKEAAV